MPVLLPPRPATDAMLTMFPDFLGSMQRRPTSCDRKKTLFRLRFMTLCHASTGYSSAAAPQVAPALFTRMSIVPNRSTTCSTRGATFSILPRSLGTAWFSMPSAASLALASSSSCSLRAVIAIRAPISPSASHICSPSPREPPVTSATLPVKSKSFLTLMAPRHVIFSGEYTHCPFIREAIPVLRSGKKMRHQATAQVKGVLLVHLREFVVESHDLPTWKEIEQRLKAIDPDVWTGLMLVTSWYPIGAWNRAFQLVVSSGGSDPNIELRRLAHFISERDLNTVFKMLLR